MPYSFGDVCKRMTQPILIGIHKLCQTQHKYAAKNFTHPSENAYNVASLTCDKSHYYEPISALFQACFYQDLVYASPKASRIFWKSLMAFSFVSSGKSLASCILLSLFRSRFAIDPLFAFIPISFKECSILLHSTP